MREERAIIIAILVYAIAEAAWLFFMRPFYSKRFARINKDNLLLIRSKLAVAIIYPLLLGAAYLLVVRRIRENRNMNRLVESLLYGALFGACVYGVYNLTNMATLAGYSWDLVVIDTIWGSVSMALFSLLCSL